MKAKLFAFLAALLITTAAARPAPTMRWYQDFRPDLPFVVRIDRVGPNVRFLLSAGPGDRTPENRGCNLLAGLGIPHTVMAARALESPAVAERVIERRGGLRKAVGLRP